MNASLSRITPIILAGLLAHGACAEPASPPEPAQPPDLATVAHTPAPSSLRRLTGEQYANAVRDLFGEDIVPPPRLEPDTRKGGFLSVGATSITISPRGAELYEEAAFNIAEQALQTPARRTRNVPCTPSGPSDRDCARQFIEQTGRRAWRRPLTEAETARLLDLFDRADAVYDDHARSLQFPLAAILQSPHFLFRKETGPTEGDATARAFDDWEMATRMAFFLWNSTPDEALLEAAARGDLTTDEGLRDQTRRMLADPRARDGLRAFFSELFELDRLEAGVVKAPEVFPHISPEVAPSAREETLRLIEHIIFEARADYRTLFTTRRTFVNRKLAAMYSVPAPSREGFGEVIFPEDNPRRGVLGHVSFLALHAHPVASSPTLRGIFIRTRLLCQIVPPAPADVDTSIPEPSGNAPTLRDRLKEHLENPACAGCHQITDPIGLGLENFDGIGRYRKRDNGVLIDASGNLDGVEFTDPAGLGEAISQHRNFAPCLTRQLYRYATGKVEEDDQLAMIEALAARFALNGHDVLALVEDLILSPAFRTTGPLDQTTTEDTQEQP